MDKGVQRERLADNGFAVYAARSRALFRSDQGAGGEGGNGENHQTEPTLEEPCGD